MELINDPDIRQFLERNLSFLEQEEAANNLMLGLAFALKKNDNLPYAPLLVTIQNGSKPIFCGLQTPPRNLILYGNQDSLIPAIDLMIDHVLNRSIELPGIIGPLSIVSPFARRWGERTGKSWKVSMDQLIYRLDQIREVKMAPGMFRVAEERDARVVIPWIERFLVEALGKAPEGEAQMIAEQKIARAELYLWEDKEIVSMAATTRPSRHGITVNFVYTPEEHRCKGYATSCVARLSARMLEQGYQFCSLFTDLRNPTSNKIYQRIGYCIVQEFQQIDFIHEA